MDKLLEELVKAAMSEAYPEGDDSNPDDDFVSCNKNGFRVAFRKVLIQNSHTMAKKSISNNKQIDAIALKEEIQEVLRGYIFSNEVSRITDCIMKKIEQRIHIS